jgi:CubicO group peptidase (beta-lactamase class C family)
VARGDQVLISKSYGSANLEWNVPNTPGTKFRLGSITKQFTAASILLLEERGKLKIEDPIRKYLPDLPMAYDKVTIFNVLTHTAGIHSFTNDPEYLKLRPFPHTPAELVALFRDKPLEFTPGEKMAYSNSGYILLGYLLEKVSGETYQAFLQKNIFEPLGMKDSGYDSNSAIIPHRAAGYTPGPNGSVNADFEHMSVPFSAGALYSTTEDLLRWEQGLFGGKLLSAASLAKMTTPLKDGYALGVSVNTINGRKRISHGGGITGFNTFLSYFPDDKLTVVALSNLNGNAPQEIAGFLADLTHGEKIVLPSERKEMSLAPKVLEQYVGVYQLAPTFNLTVTVDNGQLMVQGSGQGKVPLFASSENRFFAKVVNAQIDFSKDANGAVTSLTLHQNGNDLNGPRIGTKKETSPIDGTWTGSIPQQDGTSLDVTYLFEAMGNTLLGTTTTKLGGGSFSGGKIDGNNISFFVALEQFTIRPARFRET